MAPAIALGAEVTPWLLAGGVLLALAAALLRLDARAGTNRAFALFLSLRGLLALATALVLNQSQLAPGSLLAELTAWSDHLVPALHIAVPLAAVHFAIVYRATYVEMEHAKLWATLPLVVLVAAEALYWLEPTLWRAGSQFGPLFLFAGITYLTYALIALLMGWEYTRAEQGPLRESFLLLALAFALMPLYVGLFEFATLDVGVGLLGWREVDLSVFGPWFTASHALADAALVPLGLLVALVVRDTAARTAPQETAGVRRFFVILSLPVVTAGLATLSFLGLSGELGLRLPTGFEGLWDIAFPLIVAYALLRHQLFGIEVKVRRIVHHGTLAGAFGGVFIVASEGLEMLLPIEGAWLSFLAAAGIAMVLAPLQRVAETAAQALLPEAQDVEGLDEAQQLELFREQVEIAWMDGQFTKKDRHLLDAARERLDVAPEEADAIEDEVASQYGGEDAWQAEGDGEGSD